MSGLEPQTHEWTRPMRGRDPSEGHRQASFLELFFDLCFVVAVAQLSAQLHHAVAAGHVASGVVYYLTVFFAIWWAWMNFTWFASAYDCDDGPYRLATFVQIAGALILAAGVPRAFNEHDFAIAYLGYVVMRIGLVSLWVRAARGDSRHRATAMRYAAGLSLVMLGWTVMFMSGGWPLWAWWSLAAVELAIPVWAERAGPTPWHRGHIAERFGLFTIIVLGESILAATMAVQASLDEPGATFGRLVQIVAGGLLTIFALWWLYFAKPAAQFLESNRQAFLWGYGHYFIFGSAAAVGAGIALNVDYATAHAEIDGTAAAAAVTVPVAVFLVTLWLLHLRPHRLGVMRSLLFPATAALVLAATFAAWPILAVGLLTSALLGVSIASYQRMAGAART